VADAGQDQTATVGAAITLDGAGSSDADGDPLDYQWSLLSIPSGSAASLADPAIETPGFIADLAGLYVAQLLVSDGDLTSDPDTSTVEVLVPNRAPRITSIPTTAATVDQAYRYDGDATDPDGDDTLTWSLDTAPAGAAIDPDTGLIQWTPTSAQTGDHPVTVRVRDQGGLFDTQAFTVSVAAPPPPANRAPVITSTPVIGATAGQPYAYDVDAVDPDAGDVLAYSLPTAPTGMTIDPDAGLIGWTLTAAEIGSHPVTVRVTDQGGLFAEQDYTLTVVRDNQAPVAADDSFSVALAAPTTIAAPGVLGNDTDSDGDALTAALLTAPTNGSVDLAADGSFTYSPTVAPAPPGSNLNVRLKWAWTSSAVLPDSLNVMMTPGIIDLNGDDIPDVVFGSTDSTGGGYEVGVLRALSGADGAELFTITDSSLRVSTGFSIAVGDIDGDGSSPEIIACAATQNQLLAFNRDGTLRWRSAILEHIGQNGASLADMDGDGQPEIVVGRQVLNDDGTLRWTGTAGYGGSQWPGHLASTFALSVVADIDLDGSPEVVSGNTVYRANGDIKWQIATDDGYAAVGNFDTDPYAEIVFVSLGVIRLLEHNGVVKWGPITIPGAGHHGGPPTIADFDGDSVPEIGIAGASRYTVIEADGTIKWAAVIRDSSNITGSSVFDFDGDGSAEVVYRDELKLRVYRGSDGAVLFETEMSSCTWHEYPMVVDVDADGHAEIVTTANNNCGYGPQRGIYVFADAGSGWVPTRKIWNQHSYHITNINEDGSIPRHEAINWLFPGLNNFRLNTFSPNDRAQTDSFTYKASDALADSNLATVTITARPENQPPTIVSAAPTTATVGAAYSYQAQVTDPDAGDALMFSLPTAPTGMTLDSGTGLIHWTPDADQVGSHAVELEVRDRGGLTDRQSFTVSVAAPPPPNRPPVITSSPVTGATAGQAYTYHVEATDPDAGDVLSYALVTFPAGMSIDTVTGVIQWTATEAQVGSHAVTIRVEDQGGLAATQEFTINLGPPNHAPAISAARIAPEWLQLAPSGTPPLPRCCAGAYAYDNSNDRLIFFGGALDVVGYEHLNETWVLSNATSITGSSAWVQLTPAGTTPTARLGHLVAYDPTANRLIVHGGCAGNCWPMLDDTWVLTNANGLGGTPQWIQLPSAGIRHGSLVGFDVANNRMIVFGGNTTGIPGSDANDVRVLLDANGIGTPQWITLEPTGTVPPGIEMPSGAYDPISNRLIVAGGRQSPSEFVIDVWVLTNANGLGGTPVWTKLGPVGTPPSRRGGHSVVYDVNSNRIVVFGGILAPGTPDMYTQEAWVLTNANGIGGAPEWLKLDTPGAVPNVRAWHSIGYAGATNRMVMAFGHNALETPAVFNDAWVLSNASGLCTAGQACQFRVTASDPDTGDTLTYSLDSAPAGMTIDPATGAIDWTPTPGDMGDHPVTVRVTDSGGLSATRTFTATVAPVAVPNVVGLAPEWAESFITAADLTVGTKYTLGGAITLNFDSLPSRQGWAYKQQTPTSVPEGDVFSLASGVLHQDSIGQAGAAFWFETGSVVTPRLPFTISTRARVIADELLPRLDNRYGFSFGSCSAAECLVTGLATDTIEEWDPPGTIRSFDNTQYHDYLYRAGYGSGYRLTIDGTLFASGKSYSYDIGSRMQPRSVFVGDFTHALNARAEIAAFSFTQARVVGQNPPAGTLVPNKTAVDLTIVEGPATETVPNLIRFTQAQASAAILAANLTVGAVSTAPSNTIPAGQVSDQSPLPNIHVPKDTPVNLVISTGPADGSQVSPVILSTAVLVANVDQPYVYQVTATDANAGDSLTYTLPNAPTGMTIDPTTGLINWTPTGDQIGSHSVTVRVTDQTALFAEQGFAVLVSATANRAPAITSIPGTLAVLGYPYSALVQATDPDAGDVLTFSLPIAPAGMGIDPATGQIDWLPTADQVGAQNVAVRVQDQGGLAAQQTFTITVRAQNRAPAITSTPPAAPKVGQIYNYNVLAVDPDGDTLAYALPSAPAGMTIDPATGLIQWTPAADQIGSHAVSVRAADPFGAWTTQGFSLTVTVPNRAPSIDSLPPGGATVGALYGYAVAASDPDGDSLTYTLPAAPAGMTIDPASGLIQWTPTADQLGDNAVTVRVDDGHGGTVTQDFTLTVAPQPTVNLPPVIASSANTAARARQLYRYPVTANDPNAGDVLTFALDSAPAGMVIDPPSGVIQWVPTDDQVGDHAVSARVTDDGGLSDTQAFTVTVALGNRAPSITSVPSGGATVGRLYVYAVTASDPDAGDILSYHLDTTPTGMTIDPATGLVQWTPTADQVGSQAVTVRVQDPLGAGATQGFAITVQPAPVNHAPSITSTPVAAATADTAYGYDLNAADPDAGDVLTYALDTAPAGMTIDAATGLIQWTPTAAQVGDHAVTARAQDPGGLFATQAFSIRVAAAPPPPPALAAIRVTPGAPLTLTGQGIDFVATGILADGTSQALAGTALWSSSAPAVADIDATGYAVTAAAGTTTITARVATVSGSATLTVLAPVPNGSDPVAAITAPAEGATVTEPTAVIGTAADPEILKYVLEIAPVGTADFQTIAEGAASVTNGTLGTLDPTLLINDLYQLRLTVYDRGGFYVQTTRQVQVAREQKVGNFTLAFQDISTPMACMPLTVTRVYDSRDKGRGDFGVGWRLDVQTLRLRESGTMGDGWAIDLVQRPGPFGIPIPTYVLYDTAAHKVSLTLPDGQVEEFDLTPAPTESQFNPIDTLSLAFTPRPGTLGRLEPVVADSVIPSGTTGGVDLIDFEGETLDPRTYRYTTPEGNVYLIDKFDGVQQVQCTTGQTLTFGPDGIQHAGGKAVAFTRDAQGRITAITDPAGNVHVYSYDANGDLTAHTDPEAGATGFKYDYRHGLLEIIDPRGVRAVRNAYDASGRLIGTTDAAGQAVTFVHDLTARTETVTDRLGQVTHYAYDAAGNVLHETDALGHVTHHSYDAYGNELTRTDPLGRVTTMTYDSRRNRLTETDALGQVTGYSYTALNAVRTITDPLGRVTTNAYDSNGNLLSTVDPLNGTTEYTYDGGAIIPTRGLLLARTDALSQVTRYSYDDTGNLSRETDALGNVTDYSYDANGNRLTETRTRTLPGGGSETLITGHEYDRLNRLVRTTHPDGSTSRTEYNAIGKQARTLDALGRETRYEYDDAGRLTRTTYPDGAGESSTYDAEGRRLTSTDRAGRVTGFVYDALGRLVQTTYPDGTTTGTSYDAAGQVLSTTDALGHVTTYEYDLAGRRTKVIDTLGHETRFAYDAAGNQNAVTDANGHQVRFEYDDGNRRVRTLYPDSTLDQVGYDALGRQISKTDQAGLTTEYHYDALGRLAGVTDALGQDTTYGYDAQGNQVSQTDANGHTTTFGYDGMGRRVSRTLPLGMTETMTYDDAGNLATKTDFNGRTTSFAYDALNRLTEKRPDPATGEPVVRFTFTASGQRATMEDASGTTTYSYDDRDRLTAKATPAGTLSYSYDEAGNLLSIQSGHAGGALMTYAYDALNRLASVTDANGGVTTYTYDLVGNLAGYAYPNGVEHRYTYNVLNRLTDLALVRGGTTIASYAYTLGATGNRQSVTELSGRRAAYGYDDLYRLTSETVTGDPAGVNGTVGYDYDPVGNRLERTSTLAPVATQTFSYDANDRIGVETYDDNGNTLVTTEGRDFGYDTDNRLVSADGGVSFVYDGDGNRVARTVGGVTTGFLVDTLNPTGYSQVLEEIEGGAVVRRYTYGLDLVSQEQSSGVSFYGYDGHGSVRLLTDGAGVVTDSYEYDAFGNLAERTGVTGNVYLYAGEQDDRNIALYYLRSRYLQPSLGIFLTGDPILADATFPPLDLHSYAYANANPINQTDPSGLFSGTSVSITAPSVINAMLQLQRLSSASLSTRLNQQGGGITCPTEPNNVDFPTEVKRIHVGVAVAVVGSVRGPSTDKANSECHVNVQTQIIVQDRNKKWPQLDPLINIHVTHRAGLFYLRTSPKSAPFFTVPFGSLAAMVASGGATISYAAAMATHGKSGLGIDAAAYTFFIFQSYPRIKLLPLYSP